MTNQDLKYSRPLAKCVDVNLLDKWIPKEDRPRIDTPTAWRIIKTMYCGALVGRGVCPIDCASCRLAIESLFPLEEAKSPGALLTWRAKDRSAARIEELIELQKREEREEFPAMETHVSPLASLFHTKRGDNLFLEMEKDYE